MAGIFIEILNMSISASWIVLTVMLLRLLLKKAPKWINCSLWGIVALRLVMPFSLESVFSLIPSAETIIKAPADPRPYIESGVSIIDKHVNNYLQGSYFEGVSRPMGSFENTTTIVAVVWLVGIGALLAYTVISYLRLKCKIGTAVLLRDNIYQSEAVASPYVLGVINPMIYLPFNISAENIQNVIAHEQAHIKRKDHLWKLFGFLLLTIYWFNPVMWASYILLCRDIEFACDEKVVKDYNNEQKADYSNALLACSVNRHIIAACPLAFGEVGVKNRIKSVLNYKRPSFWVIVAALIVSVIVSVCFLTDPVKNIKIENGIYTLSEIAYYDGAYSCIHDGKNEKIEIENTSGMHIYRFIGEELSTEVLYEEVKPDKDIFEHFFEGTQILTGYENAREFIRDNKKSWYYISSDNTACYPYMLLLQNDGSLYIAFADFENGKPVKICHIYKLEYYSTNPSNLLNEPTSPYRTSTDYTMYSYSYQDGIEVYPTIYLSQTDDYAVLTWMDYNIHKTTVIGQGKYVIDKKELIITCNDTNIIYVFDVVSDGEYKFNADKSSENPEYDLSNPENPIAKIDIDKLFMVSGETNALPIEAQIAHESAY